MDVSFLYCGKSTGIDIPRRPTNKTEVIAAFTRDIVAAIGLLNVYMAVSALPEPKAIHSFIHIILAGPFMQQRPAVLTVSVGTVGALGLSHRRIDQPPTALTRALPQMWVFLQIARYLLFLVPFLEYFICFPKWYRGLIEIFITIMAKALKLSELFNADANMLNAALFAVLVGAVADAVHCGRLLEAHRTARRAEQREGGSRQRRRGQLG